MYYIMRERVRESEREKERKQTSNMHIYEKIYIYIYIYTFLSTHPMIYLFNHTIAWYWCWWWRKTNRHIQCAFLITSTKNVLRGQTYDNLYKVCQNHEGKNFRLCLQKACFASKGENKARTRGCRYIHNLKIKGLWGWGFRVSGLRSVSAPSAKLHSLDRGGVNGSIHWA